MAVKKAEEEVGEGAREKLLINRQVYPVEQ